MRPKKWPYGQIYQNYMAKKYNKAKSTNYICNRADVVNRTFACQKSILRFCVCYLISIYRTHKASIIKRRGENTFIIHRSWYVIVVTNTGLIGSSEIQTFDCESNMLPSKLPCFGMACPYGVEYSAFRFWL